ncbi:tetratricopeptide repeat protein (plasmid) [Streptomyces sp. NBC_00080]|uniref:tetratricopeptide repeat protein n=1 Tax=unclassified Streptomyces TaxID=2593676 RepID=UPI00114D976B|nr:tetratricopeptide repeat protein [Streptomyces sp. SLBN-115]
MDAADLECRARTRSGCIPPELVSRLLERGHVDVVELHAGRGQWFCALAWARLLGEEGRQVDALEVLGPYLATGWWTAVEAAAELLEDWGRVDEAIEITRVRMEAGHPMALESYTRLLARHGRAEEAFTLLRRHIGELPLGILVDVAGAAGRDEEAAALVAARTEHECSDFPWCCRGLDRDTAFGYLAVIRERQGRTDEAIALLCASSTSLLNNREQLAAVLGRHGRLDELRAMAATDDSGCAVRQLARLLEESGDVAGAIAAYRQADQAVAGDSKSAFELAQLLARHGRGSEAIDVMRVQADIYNGYDWVLHTLAELCLDQGRPEEGLAHLDALAAARGGEEEWDLYWIRLPLIAACDGVDEAVAQARSHPEGTTRYAASHIAEVLAGAGRTEEAVAVLEQHSSSNCHDLAGYLIDLGRVEDALAILLQPALRPPKWAGGLWHDEPPF